MLTPESRFGIFVMSSDKTADVARHFAGAFDRHVSSVDWEIFWGTNTSASPLARFRATPLRAKSSGWKDEVLAQLQQLRAERPTVSHVVVFLDDFILTNPVDIRSLEPMLTDAVERGVKYLRLAPIEESLASRLLARGESELLLGGRRCKPIRRTHPYYSSLQVAMWDVEHLTDCVSRAANIWAFESQTPVEPHYSVVRPAITYRHAVEKGAWDHGAGKLCLKHAGFFTPGDRRRRTGLAGTIRRHLVRIQFAIAGYAPSRMKRFFLGHLARP